jgi:6-phosphogluconolactonase/glucosamine-6-phosphate isomerase/deaminase
MQFVKVKDWQPGIDALGARLKRELKSGKKVLWLVPGGSNIPAAARIMATLPDELTERLAILLTDERYGIPGHKDSNYKQLLAAGFDRKQAMFMPALVEGLNLQETARHYEELVERAFSRADTVIGQFGIGTDGHIAGILPHSPAASSGSLVAGYEAPPYVRLTLTLEALAQLSAAYAFVFGGDKLATLEKLQAEELPLQEQPAQILKHLPEAYIYSDQL